MFYIRHMPMIDRFIVYIQDERRLSELTVRNYKIDIATFIDWYKLHFNTETFDATLIKSEDIRDWIIFRLDTAKLSAASMNREISTIKSLFRYLRKIKAIDSDPLKHIRSLKTNKVLPQFVPESRMRPLLLETKEQSRSEEFKQIRNGLIISLLYGCGIRLAELLAIRVKDITNGAVKVHGKGDKDRIIPLLPELENRIDSYIETCREIGFAMESESYLILGTSGNQLSRSTVQRVVSAQMVDANI